MLCKPDICFHDTAHVTANLAYRLRCTPFALYTVTVAMLTQAFDPKPHLVDYAMTKAAIVNFTKSMAKGLIDKGVRVNAVAPGTYYNTITFSNYRPYISDLYQ
jgi:NAD(P)-dependent dehydrogenase (short-subunit alcohol dehydrogenase family)